MRRLTRIVAGGVLLILAWAAPAATLLVAPESVRELLQQNLTLGESDGDAPAVPADGGAGATRERRLRKEVGELLATAGYFSPQVAFSQSADGDLRLQVDPGVQASVGELRLESVGALAASRRQQLVDGWSLPVGAAFSQAAWDEAKQALVHELMRVDYADARLLSSEAEVDVDAARVVLTVVYDAGARVRYGATTVAGLHRYSPALVERYSGKLRAGEPYRNDDLLSVQSALQNTQYFSSASVELASATDEGGAGAVVTEGDEADAADEVRPVSITLRERAPFHVALGAGYSSNTGARVEGNFRNADLFNRAWELNSGARIEQLRQIAYADVFLPPDVQNRRDSFGALAETSDIQGLAIKRAALAVARAEQRGPVEQQLGLNWQYEQQTPDGAESSINRALTATVGWLWRHADDPRDAAEGIVAQLQFGAAAKALLSDQNFLRSYFRYSQGIPLSPRDSLLLRGEVGVTLAPSRQGIPQDYLFRTGGSTSVRGYDYLSLGVEQGTATVGGRYLLVVSGEYTRWIDAQWGVATFVDAGQAADDRDVLKLALGCGVGARWKSPAGPLAVDLGWGQRSGELHLHFSLAVPF